MFDENEEDFEEDTNDRVSITPTITPDLLIALGISVDEVKESVIARIAAQTLNSIREDVKSGVAKTINSCIEMKVSEWVAGFLEKPYQPVDSWGKPKGAETTIQKLIEGRSAEFMREEVDAGGKKSDGYRSGDPRYLWAAKKVAGEAIEKELRPHLNEVVKEMKVAVEVGIKNLISDLVARNFSK